MHDLFVVVSTDRDGNPSSLLVIGAEACAVLIIYLVKAGHTGISNYITDPPKPPARPAKSRPLQHWAMQP